ncbi:NAD(P)/FAD-dependent oxidoreductase [Streptomyces sp. NPDC101160]|uniref:NAD(P)/FAD-dependent oxidoreductase n=1 Tax=Streptomyces sp. NPDC101160 TaxID=3366118 RepID=UPI0037FC85F5
MTEAADHGPHGDHIDFRGSVFSWWDAAGRAGPLTACQLRTRRFHDAFRNVAAWGYWRDAEPAPDAPEGAIRLYSLPDHGWFWTLHDGTLSVGLVTDKHSFAEGRRALGGTEALYADRLERTPALARLLADADRVTDLRVESDYSYVADRFCGPGWYAAGDAACFLDPLLSTGVHLALYSGMLAAASVAATCTRTPANPKPPTSTRAPTGTPTSACSSSSAPSTTSTGAATPTSAAPSG